MNNLHRKLEKGLTYFCLFLLGVSVSLLVAIIFLRAVFGIGYDFLTDAVVWLTVWSTMLYIGPLYGEGGHVSIKFILEKLTGKVKVSVEVFNALITLFYVGTVTLGGCIAIHTFYSHNQTYARYVAIPMWIVQICIPIGFGLLLLYVIAELWGIIRGRQASNTKTT